MGVFGEAGVPSIVGVLMGWGFEKAFGEDGIVLPLLFPSRRVMGLG